jgi:hypothetical protein
MARRLVRCIHTQPGTKAMSCENISRRAVIGGAATVVPAVVLASVLALVDNTDATAEGRGSRRRCTPATAARST